ncbi:catecholate siderophore receptor Fiu [Azonexus sp. R2A61]|uniref:catecholate siderophore receptor Fiu n=1 Tax=Azonexus sp. R2A61 TaxID=2744443 RepID=UPI001F1CC458|nr:catecholate siderophore receptor Fiu [Azonexus sp. R2A61]
MAHIRSRKHPAPSHLLALMAAAIPVAVHAQEAEKTLPAMTVKADADVPYKAEKSANTKFTQPLVDTPQTVQVIRKEILQEQGAATLMEALRNTPGITMQLGENGNTAAGDTFQMRGFSTQTSTFVDGIRDLGAVTRDVFNLEQVEVVKGPAGSDIGRGSQSGYINLISKLPQAGDINSASVSVGTDNYKRLTADLNKQIGDGVALRLNVMGQDADVAGRDYVKNKGYGIAPAIALGLNSPTRFYLYSQHLRQDNVPDGGIPSIGMPGYFHAIAEVRDGAKVNRENYYGSKNDYEKIDADMVTAKFEHDLGGGSTVRNITRYGRNKIDRVLTGVMTIATPTPADPSTWTLSRSRQRVDQENEILANQTSLNSEFSTGFIKHSLVAGLELMYERQKSRTFATMAQTINGVAYAAINNPVANLYSPNADDDLGIPYATGAYVDGKSLTTALYLFDNLKFSERFMLNGGLRFERYRVSTDGRTLVTGGANGNQAIYPGYAVGQLAPDNIEASDNLFSWKLGAVYKPASNGSLYAAYARSLTPPGSSNFQLAASSSNQSNAAMDPQETVNIELGTKWELLEKRLNVSTALYRTENDKQVTLVDAVTNTYAQVGKTRVDGIELSAVGQITNFWQISAGVAKMKTKQLSMSNADAVRWSPDLTATLWTSYTLGDFTLGGGVRYVSEQKRVINPATPLATQAMPKIPSYWVADMMAAYKVNKFVNLRLNVYNLFDKEYINTLNNGGARITLGAPRTAVLSANFQF